MTDKRVLVVEGDPVMQRHLETLLQQWGYAPVIAPSLKEALAAVSNTKFHFSLFDLDLDWPERPKLLMRLKRLGENRAPVILFSGTKDIKRMAAASVLGPNNLVQNPFDPEELENAIKQLTGPPWGEVQADDSIARLQQATALWRSRKMQEVGKIVHQAARANVTVLIRGETGTGKDLVARSIHHLSPRKDQPFVKVNCAAVPRELLESELFGHERGAFTGAHQLKIGKFESANHGTAFLDEIGDLHSALQAKLLHILQDGEFSRVGGRSTIKADVRVIAATNQDLERAVGARSFRDDLYYRLNVIQIVVPPLRERPEEIPLLINYFLERYSTEFHREGFAVPRSVMERLIRYSYPGNIRELENIIKRMIVLNNPFIYPSLLHPTRADDGGHSTHRRPKHQPLSLKAIGKEAARRAEQRMISKALEQTGWNRVRAARLLGISYRALLYKMKESGLSHGPGALPTALN